MSCYGHSVFSVMDCLVHLGPCSQAVFLLPVSGFSNVFCWFLLGGWWVRMMALHSLTTIVMLTFLCSSIGNQGTSKCMISPNLYNSIHLIFCLLTYRWGDEDADLYCLPKYTVRDGTLIFPFLRCFSSGKPNLNRQTDRWIIDWLKYSQTKGVFCWSTNRYFFIW